jgi:hypothetical protein
MRCSTWTSALPLLYLSELWLIRYLCCRPRFWLSGQKALRGRLQFWGRYSSWTAGSPKPTWVEDLQQPLQAWKVSDLSVRGVHPFHPHIWDICIAVRPSVFIYGICLLMKEKLNGSKVLSQEVWREAKENIYSATRLTSPSRISHPRYNP